MEIERLDSVDSTNRYLLNKIKNGEIDNFPYVVMAKTQTAGRGRYKRKWESALGGLYFSIGDKFFKLNGILKISMNVAAILHKFLKNRFETGNIFIKWPNDIYFGDKKLSGILTENLFFGDIVYNVIGVGININNDVTLKNAISLKSIIGNEYDIELFFEQFVEFYEKEKENDFYEYISDNLWHKNELSELKIGEKMEKGVILGIDKDYSLILADEKNVQKRIIIGEIVEK